MVGIRYYRTSYKLKGIKHGNVIVYFCINFDEGIIKMTDKQTGGYAFPTETDLTYQHGMTLRDYFAAKAMQGMLTRPGSINVNDDASFAYKMADAMLKAREQA